MKRLKGNKLHTSLVVLKRAGGVKRLHRSKHHKGKSRLGNDTSFAAHLTVRFLLERQEEHRNEDADHNADKGEPDSRLSMVRNRSTAG